MKSCVVILFSMGMLLSAHLFAQDTSLLKQRIPSVYMDKVSNKVSKIENKLDKQTEKTLKAMRKEERRLERKLKRMDSVAAQKLFSNSKKKYTELNDRLNSKTTQSDEFQYMPYMDTLKNALTFLEKHGGRLIGNSGEQQGKIKDALKKVNSLDSKMDKVQSIQQALKERRQYLKEQLSRHHGMSKYMKRMNKKVYYYSQAIKEYKNVLKDTKKMESTTLGLLSKTPAFKKFMQNNSKLSSLFGIPSEPSAASPVSFTGLQTRASVQQTLQNMPVSASSPQQFVNQQLQTANHQLSQQKNKIRFPELDENLDDMPDFKPNSQKSKPFLKRLEYGANIQFGKTNQLLPATSELAVSLGYKLNDNGVIGIGSAYKLGLGSGIKNIRFSHQGYGMRSYVDWKIKGSFYVSGGYEKNYLPQLNDIEIQQKPEMWQQSGLLGIKKSYPVSKKRKGFAQVLFDFLSYKNIPRSQPVLIRTGINF